MAINKNFVIKNGIQVSTDLIIGDTDNNKVGIGTTIPGYDLHIGRGRKSRGGIGATDLVVTGVGTITNLNITGISTFAGALDVNSTVDFAGDVVFNGTNDITFDQSESALVLNDGAALRVGTSSDFSISHDGNNTILRDNGTGDLQIYASRIELGGASVDETIAMFTENGGAQLFFNNVNKFETTGVGATVFGDFVVSGVTTSGKLNVQGVSTFTSIGSNLIPDADGSRNIGAATSEWGDLFIDGTANIDSLAADTAAIGDLTDNRVVIAGSSGELEDDANFTFDGSKLNVGSGVATVFVTTGNVAFAGIATVGGALLVGAGVTVGGDILPDADGSRDLGSSAKEFQDLFIDGTANIDSLAADTAAIADLTDNRVVIAGSSGELEDDANFTFDGAMLKVGTAATIAVNGNAAFAGIVTVGGDLNVIGDIVYDEITGRNLNITGISTQAGQVNFGTSGVGATIFANGNVAISGITTINGAVDFNSDLDVDGTANLDVIDVDGTANFADDVTLVAAGSSTILFDASAHKLVFQDNIRANFGTGEDLSIYHDSLASYIHENGTGNLRILASNLRLADSSNNQYAFFTAGGAAELNFGGNKKFETTADGILVGTGVTIQGNGGVSIAGLTTANGGVQVGAAITLATNGNAGFTGIVTAGGGFNIGIQSAGTVQASGPIKTLNFVGTGNTFLYNAGSDTIDISIAGGGGSGGVSETETSVSTTSATSCGTFDKTEKRSAAVLAQITQGSAYQIGRYLLIHDGTTVTTIEESAIATGSMLGTFEGVINGDNVEFRVTMSSSSSATVTTKIDSISIP